VWEVVVAGQPMRGVNVDGVEGKMVESTERLKVPGGWLYRLTTNASVGDVPLTALAVCFVPEGIMTSFQQPVVDDQMGPCCSECKFGIICRDTACTCHANWRAVKAHERRQTTS